MMSTHSTLRRIVETVPATTPAGTVARHLRCPDTTGKRVAEGGLRLNGRFKAPDSRSPLVTIVTICLNSVVTLEQTILSVLRQTHDNIEFVVVDGGSTDGTLELIGRHSESIDYFVCEPDAGLYQAMNKGLSLATGEYILVLNSDDWYVDDCVESLVDAARYSGRDVVSGLAQHVDAAGAPVKLMRSMPYDASMRLRMPLRHETMLVPASIYNAVGGYDETYRIIADFDLTLRMFERGCTHYEIPRPLMFFRNTGISSTSKAKLFDERARLIGARFPFLDVKELKSLAKMSDFRPDDLDRLARKHVARDDLVDTLKCYQVDQSNRDDAPAWSKHRIDWPDIGGAQGIPRVSVILPVYDAEDTLRACIDSVLAQTLTDLELICINDVTPDGSQAIIDEYCRRDPRVRSLVNEKNVGLGASRNRGVRAARGGFVFHVDPDDSIPEGSLATLHSFAVANGSEMVKGAYLREQIIQGRKPKGLRRESLCAGAGPIVNTTLAQMPQLLRTTEGHWSYLYSAGLARRVPYPTDLKMGQDSIFLVGALSQARSISVIDEDVYHYRANPHSAMNTFNFRKFSDALEWRRRAWHVLADAGLQAIGDRLLNVYWSEDFFVNLARNCTPGQVGEFFDALRQAFGEAGTAQVAADASPFLRSLFEAILAGSTTEAILERMVRDPAPPRAAVPAKPEKPAVPARPAPAAKPQASTVLASAAKPLAPPVPAPPTKPRVPTAPAPATKPVGEAVGEAVDEAVDAEAVAPVARPPGRLRIATLCSMDHGGAGTGTQRRVRALRQHGVDASIHSLVVTSSHPYVKRVVPGSAKLADASQASVWKEVRNRAILPALKVPGFRARELFSLPAAVVDFREMKATFEKADVVHLHWVVGMFDYPRAVAQLAGKAMVWTLADMNAFTGGCHYSEGCDGYTRECRACPLLGGKSDLAHRVWKIKKEVYANLRHLHIVCPSEWMAKRVAASTLLGDKPIHYIPNAFPIDRFYPTNRVVARIRLGLPVDRKLLLFGADSLANKRKGGDHLRSAITLLAAQKDRSGVEVIVFGNSAIDLPVRVHSLGHISDDVRLALVYSAADAFVFPSSEDNAPLTVGESLLCGTPVVAFPVGNVPQLVQHERTGYIASYLDSADLMRGIEWVLDADRKESLRRSILCRKTAAKFHDPALAVDRHLAVYRSAMGLA
ncbi:MAG: glycosyltransferase [Caldimonas sp.]